MTPTSNITILSTIPLRLCEHIFIWSPQKRLEFCHGKVYKDRDEGDDENCLEEQGEQSPSSAIEELGCLGYYRFQQVLLRPWCAGGEDAGQQYGLLHVSRAAA